MNRIRWIMIGNFLATIALTFAAYWIGNVHGEQESYQLGSHDALLPTLDTTKHPMVWEYHGVFRAHAPQDSLLDDTPAIHELGYVPSSAISFTNNTGSSRAISLWIDRDSRRTIILPAHCVLTYEQSVGVAIEADSLRVQWR